MTEIPQQNLSMNPSDNIDFNIEQSERTKKEKHLIYENIALQISWPMQHR